MFSKIWLRENRQLNKDRHFKSDIFFNVIGTSVENGTKNTRGKKNFFFEIIIAKQYCVFSSLLEIAKENLNGMRRPFVPRLYKSFLLV